MRGIRFIGTVVVVAVLGVCFIVSLGIILSNQYSITNAPTIILNVINVIALVALAFFTYSYMQSTALMATEMRVTREMEFEINNRPKIQVRFELTSNGAVYITVINAGNGAARNIKMSSVPKLKNSSGESLDKWPAFKDGISYLAPKDKVRFFFDTSFSLIGNQDVPKNYTFSLEYDWVVEGRPRINETYLLDITPYIGTDLASYKDFSTLIDEVEKIRKELEKRKKVTL